MANPEIIKRTVLVTGASGFVGQAVIPLLAETGWHVRAASRTPTATFQNQPNITQLTHGDLTHHIDWKNLLGTARYVVHLAGIAHTDQTIPDAIYRQVNTTQTIALARASREQGITRLVFISSIRAQTGPAATDVLTETSPAHPTDAYGRSKLEAEHSLIAELNDEVTITDWTILRPVLVYGESVKGNLRALMRLAASPLPLPLGSLTAQRSLLDLAALADAISHSLTSKLASRQIFLVSDNEPVTVPDILRAMRAGLNRRPALLPIPPMMLARAAAVLRKQHIWQRLTSDLIATNTKLRETGWTPQHATAQSIENWVRRERLSSSQTRINASTASS